MCWIAHEDIVMTHFHNFQGSKLQELLTDCWDCDPDARLSAQCVVERLISLQSCYSA